MTTNHKLILLLLVVLPSYIMAHSPTDPFLTNNEFVPMEFYKSWEAVATDAISGPLYKSSTSKKGILTVQFINTGSGLMVGRKSSNTVVPIKERVKGFEIAGKDGRWKKAGAAIVSENEIEVWNSSVEKPKYVRYARPDNPEKGNLYNKEGVPVASFCSKK